MTPSVFDSLSIKKIPLMCMNGILNFIKMLENDYFIADNFCFTSMIS